MRKGQQKLLDKAATWGESARRILADESYTIDELNEWFWVLKGHEHEELSQDLVEKIHHLIFHSDFRISYSQNPYLSLAQWHGIYEQFLEKCDSKKAYWLTKAYADYNSYQEQPVCSMEVIEKMCEASNFFVDGHSNVLAIFKYREYFENHLYTGDNLDDIFKAEELYDKYFGCSDIGAKTKLEIVHLFSDGELKEIYNDPSDIYMLPKCKMYLFKKHFPEVYQACLECYENDTAEEKFDHFCCAYLKNFVVYDPDKIKQMQKILDSVEPDEGLTIRLRGSFVYASIDCSLQGFVLSYNYGSEYVGKYEYKNKVLTSDISTIAPKSTFQKKYLFFYDNDAVYQQIKREKWIPCSYEKFSYLNDSLFNVGKVLFLEYVDQQIEKGHYIWKDIQANNYYSERHLPPFKVEDLNAYHTFDELMRAKYKHADFVNWNKCDIQWCYAIMKMLPKVNKQSQDLLLSLKYSREYSKIWYSNKSSIDSIARFIMQRLDSYSSSASDSHTQDILDDYLGMCKLLKKKFNLCFLSGKKMKEEHDRLSTEYTNRHTPTIKIPKNTKFKELDKCLPDSFEKMSSRRRIVQEGTQMHHCVAFYAPLINKDGCAIYSFLYEGKRYTVEFGKNAKGYYIRQLYGVWNRDAPLRVWDYVRSFMPKFAKTEGV